MKTLDELVKLYQCWSQVTRMLVRGENGGVFRDDLRQERKYRAEIKALGFATPFDLHIYIQQRQGFIPVGMRATQATMRNRLKSEAKRWLRKVFCYRIRIERIT